MPGDVSLTHIHLLACVNSSIKDTARTIRILDAGCGNGCLIQYLQTLLTKSVPFVNAEIYGFDVYDASIQQKGFISATIGRLSQVFPEINWPDRVKLVSSESAWPYPDDFFDIILSNQVMEHVFDHAFFLSELRRTLKPDGVSFHLFPLTHCIFDGHLLLPFVHRIANWRTLCSYIKWCSKIGLGKYPGHKKTNRDLTADRYAERHADYMTFQVHYLSGRQLKKLCKRAKLRWSFDYTYCFYFQKTRSLLRLSPLKDYSGYSPLLNAISFGFCKYVNCITLVLSKRDSYSV